MEGKINSKFELAKFRLFNDQINGGVQECCEVALNGIPYHSINNAGRIQVGLDIIRTMQAYYDKICPVWIDNRESIIDLPEMPGQIISMIVSAQDKELRIENQETRKEVS